MPTPTLVLLGLLQALLVLLAAPFFSGLARVLRAKLHSRKGPDVWQNYRDLVKLFQRQEVVPAPAGWVYRAAPYVTLATTLLIAGMIPILTRQSPLGRAGDAILVIYLFGLTRFFLALAGLETGSIFAGIGASREMGLSALVEPTLILVLLVLSLAVGSTDLGRIAAEVAAGAVPLGSPGIWLAGAAMAVAAYIEAGKLPFDLAEAEQELQEGPLAEYSGPSLALLKWSLYMKQVLAAALFLALFFPGGAAEVTLAGILGALGAFFLKVTALFVLGALVENTMARLILFKAPEVTWVAFGLALAAFVFQLVNL
ncbi:MAG: respiratory chain complex I subunit 1 family protein [Firmicutes bacterium]|nr:respiratory chain complex I subunit 1 family protein [Bacillota bacterium]